MGPAGFGRPGGNACCIVRRLAQASDSTEPSQAARPRQGYFFGWNVVGFTFFAQFLTMGTLFYAFGPLLKPLTVALDADRFEVSLALSLQSAVAALAGPWVGRLVAERSIRALMLAGAGMLLLGFLGMGQAQNVWHLYLTYGFLLGWAMALAGPIPTNTLIANWFDRRRGMAFGIAGFGISISGTVVIPVTSWMLLEYDWRVAVYSFGIAAFAILVPLTILFAVKRPEDRGLLPDNAGPDLESAADSFPEDPAGASHWKFLRAVRDRRIWHLVVIIGTSFLGIGGVLLALHSHMTDIGLSAMQAATVMAVMTFMGAIAKPLFGITSDHINKRLAMGISLCCQIAGLSLIMAFDSQLGLTLAVVVFGLGYGAVSPLWSVLLAAMFGRAAFARILGVMAPLTTPFMLAGMPFTTWFYENTGSYMPAFAVLIGGFVVSLAALSMLRLPEEKRAEA